MNYRNVLGIKKLLEQRLKSEIAIDNFQDDYLAEISEAREIKQISEYDDY